MQKPIRSPSGAVRRIVVGTDRTKGAERAVSYAAEMANRYGAELILVSVLPPQNPALTEAGAAETTRATFVQEELFQEAQRLAGERGTARVMIDEDIAGGILAAVLEVDADMVVVGNLGMTGRKEFLLGNVPNRVSHNARCTVVIVNTAQPDGKAEPVAVAPTVVKRGTAVAGEDDPLLMGRATHIAAVMARHGVKHLFSRTEPGTDSARAAAKRLREALDELGPTFAKLGQVLSTRPDLMPAAYIEELATLQDRVTPLTESEVVQVMEQELGVPWEDVFETIDEAPMAAGTIAQVHKATLTGGERVVVKVQRPTARHDIMQDLGLFKLFAEKTADRPAFKQVIDMGAIVEHLSDSLQRELDFRSEANNVERMRKVLEPYDRLDVPGVHNELSTARLLVMEEIQGVPIRQAPESPERKEAARQLLESYYRQILTDGFFHADPHPGNLMWWKDKIYFLDFGMVGEVGAEIRELLMLMLMAFWQEDVAFLSDVVLMIAGSDQRADVDVQSFQDEMGSLLARYRHESLKDIQLGPILQEITEISIRHDVPLPASLALTGKALAQMQLATAELDPDLDPFAVAGSFLMRSFRDNVRGKLDLRKLFYESQKYRVRFQRMVESVERLVGARPGPKMQIHFRGTERLEETVRRAGRRLSLGVTAGTAIVGTAIVASSTHASGWIVGGLGALAAALTGGLLIDLLRRGR